MRGKKGRRRSTVIPKTTGNPELKVTTQGKGADTPVWAPTGSTKDSSSSSDPQSKGDSGLGSNPSFWPHQDTDTELRQGTTPRPSPDPTKKLADDDPLSERGEGDGDQEIPKTNELQDVDTPADPGPVPGEVPKEVQMGDDQVGAGDGEEAQDPEEPWEPGEPLEPYEVILQGFRMITQTLLAAY